MWGGISPIENDFEWQFESKRQNFQLIRATYAFRMKNNVSTEEKEYADKIFS